jgi:hypothetical protein
MLRVLRLSLYCKGIFVVVARTTVIGIRRMAKLHGWSF